MMDDRVKAVLTPRSPSHEKLRSYLLDRLKQSERKMAQFHSRWRANEMRAQAYITLPNYEQILKDANDSGKPPQVTNIIVPYGFSTSQAICTYLLHTFCGRKPMFSVGAYDMSSSDMIALSKDMESVLDYNATRNRVVRHFWQMFNDVMNYGVGVLRCEFKKEEALRSRWHLNGGGSFFDQLIGPTDNARVREKSVIFEGNEIESIDPFMFFPDPRVPMSECAKKGEWVFFRSFLGRLALKKLERDGTYAFVDEIPREFNRGGENTGSESIRNLLASGDQPASHGQDRVGKTIQIDHGVVELIPNEFDLSDEDGPEKWLFTLGNQGQIIRAEPFICDHDSLPFVATEPYLLGYGFGQPALMDYLSPFQDLMSWMVNSHMFNVRASLNNIFLVDPQMVELQDLRTSEPGKIIRLKRSAYGQDVRQAIQQLAVGDVTNSHMQDLRTIMALADMISGVNDNLRGQQESGGRKTATEVRQSTEAGASRLAALSRVISSQAVSLLTEMQCLNIQQFMSMEFFLKLCGQPAAAVLMRPDMEVGDFYFPIHDGTLPMDKVALFEIWQQNLTTVLTDIQLRQSYDVVRIFEFVAKLGGAENVADFRMLPQGMPVPQLAEAGMGAIQSGVQAGNVIPLNQAVGGMR